MLNKDSKLIELDLEDNHLGDLNIANLCKAMHSNKQIKSLNFSKNLISNKGAFSISGLLKENKSLEVLILIKEIIAPLESHKKSRGF